MKWKSRKHTMNLKQLLRILLILGFSLIVIYFVILKDDHLTPTQHSKTSTNEKYNVLFQNYHDNQSYTSVVVSNNIQKNKNMYRYRSIYNSNNRHKLTYYNVLFFSWHTHELVKTNMSKILRDWRTLSISLQYYYTTIYNNYNYTHYTFNYPANNKQNSIDCTTWK
eukprot:426041_1